MGRWIATLTVVLSLLPVPPAVVTSSIGASPWA